MNKADLIAVVGNVPAGTLLQIVFRTDAAQEVQYLIGMLNGGILRTREGGYSDFINLMIDMREKKWTDDGHRIVLLETTETFHEQAVDWFTDRMWRALESCHVCLYPNRITAVTQFLEWLKKVGHATQPNISSISVLKIIGFRSAWVFEAMVPYGRYTIFNDTGEVKVEMGPYGSDTGRYYDKEGNPLES